MKRTAMIVFALVLTCVFFSTPVQAQPIDVDPTSFDFGPVEVGESASTIFTVTGAGPGEAIVSGIWVEAHDPVAFSITSAPTLPIILPQGEQCNIEVTYTPPSTGIHNTNLAIQTTDVSQPTTRIPLQGEGVPNTPVGEDVVVTPPDCPTGTVGGTPVTITFDTVTEAGATTLCTGSAGPPPPSGFLLISPATYYEINTTASYSGNIEICINYGQDYPNEEELRLFHFEEEEPPQDVTSSLNTDENTICGIVTSLSSFAIFAPVEGPNEIDIKPKTLNVKSKGKWITSHIEVPECNPEDIIPGTLEITNLKINGIDIGGFLGLGADIDKSHPVDQDEDEIPDAFMAKFDRQELITAIKGASQAPDVGELEVTVEGDCPGSHFVRSDTIQIIKLVSTDTEGQRSRRFSAGEEAYIKFKFDTQNPCFVKGVVTLVDKSTGEVLGTFKKNKAVNSGNNTLKCRVELPLGLQPETKVKAVFKLKRFDQKGGNLIGVDKDTIVLVIE